MADSVDVPQFGETHIDRPNGDSFSEYRWNFKKIKSFVVYILIPMALVAMILSIVAFVQMKEFGHLSNDSNEASNQLGRLAVSGDGLALRIASEKCDSDYCDGVESIYCEEEGSLRTLHEAEGDLLCVCDGKAWNCDMTGSFCKTNPLLPSGAEFLPGKSCINTASSKTCTFSCSGSLIPSGEFTCTNGQWDQQHCVCSASDLESAIHEAGIFGVIKTESCDQTKSEETCDAWACEGDLQRGHDSEIKCGKNGWEVHQNALCVCQSNTLFATLAMAGNGFVDVTRCDKTPAGEICDKGYWFCPHQLHQQGEFECNKKDGSWIVPEHPCICSDDYANGGQILGFDKSCGYLAVGQSCAHDEWDCKELLIPVSSLECTTNGLVGECGCSAEELEKLPASSDAIVSGCDKTTVNEICTDWNCSPSNKLCCSSPTCNEDGSWNVEGNMCSEPEVISCDVDDLADYFPISCPDDLPPGSPCSIRCNVSTSNSFTCPGQQDTCTAMCKSDGTWDVPCICNPSTLSKHVPFANSSTDCPIGHKCTVSCPEKIVESVVCDPWVGYTGYCGCPALGEILGCSTEEECGGFDPWACENYPIGRACSPAEFCLGSLELRIDFGSQDDRDMGPFFCSGSSSWIFRNGTAVSDPDVFPQLCACPAEDICDAIGGNGGCSGASNGKTVVLGTLGDCSVNSFDSCNFECGDSVYSGGELICETDGVSCPNDDCNCCPCDASSCGSIHGQVLCGNTTTCGDQMPFNSTLDCPAGTSYMGLCAVNETGMDPATCYSCICSDSKCDGKSDSFEICFTSGCGQSPNCDYPNVIGGQCFNETCILP